MSMSMVSRPPSAPGAASPARSPGPRAGGGPRRPDSRQRPRRVAGQAGHQPGDHRVRGHRPEQFRLGAQHEPEHHLDELALMTVLAEWLTRWQPISMHRALLAGATPDQVAEAAGTSVRGVYELWKQWADGQRHSLMAGRPRRDPGGL